MDEWMLNDLLECSICLERLDTSSRVLPCQHTFCKKCLEEIVSTRCELRCPECRVLVDARVEDLPPNVLLMRILEGMRHAAGPNRRPAGQLGAPPGGHIPPGVVQHLTAVAQRSPPRAPAAAKPPAQPYARALYDYQSSEPGDLNFKKGDVIMLRKKIDANWCQGECGDSQGVFPLTYVQVITPLPSHIPQCKALYDFRMTDDEEGCLTFNKGEVINVIRRVDENWAEGKLADKIGIFPLAFVELNSVARALMKLSVNSQPGPSRVAPPTPTSEETVPLIPTDHSRTVSLCRPPPAPASDSSSTLSSASSSTTTPNTSSSNTSSSSSTAPSSPQSPPPPRPADQRHGFGRPLSHRHSAEILSPTEGAPGEVRASEPSPQAQVVGGEALQRQNSQRHRRSGSTELPGPPPPPPPQGSQPSPGASVSQLPTAYVALYPYKPQKADELELRKGCVYVVTERCQDGWFKGTSSRTQKSGVFPGNYVALAKTAAGLQAQLHGMARPGNGRGPCVVPQPSARGAPSATAPVTYTRGGGGGAKQPSIPLTFSPRQHTLTVGSAVQAGPPDLPPRSCSPAVLPHGGGGVSSASWHGQQPAPGVESPVPLGRSHSAVMVPPAADAAVSTTITPPPNVSVPAAKLAERMRHEAKDKKEKVGLMRRLTSMKKSRSPPPATYSMDNPVFEDGSVVVSPSHPVHVRVGETTPACSSHHRKSNSLDADSSDASRKANKPQTVPVRERFRCIVPYPPNSEYELELRVGDIIHVHKKRDDGWYKGTQQRTGRTGLFPASFVECL
ncbi:E3 ubiquitin-protein ligase SH3RF3-like isoform X2 [Bacillus rossius redtenbacheri]|uniref:E3 ubiquitin-protein ligase SH3RF3-like isoform X2 n=1 Tax=Bacillus rossius redtenbacheri TaxID=93214 RepID=UPI002FDCC612